MFKDHQITKKMYIDTLIVMVVAELTGSLTCLIDGIITGQFLGNNAMAAFNYSCIYFNIVSIINGILMVGNQTLCVGTISKGDKESTDKIISITLIMGMFLPLIITCFMFFFPELTALIFGVDTSSKEIMENFIPYIKGVCLGAPFWCLFVTFTPIVQLDGGSSTAKIAAIANGITDVALDFILGVVLKMGMFGMGLATSASHLVGCVVIMSHFFSKESTYKFSFKNIGAKYIGPILKNGLPRAVSMVARTIGPILLNLIILNIASDATDGIFALSVQRSISFIAASLGWGICGTTLMLETLYYKEKNIEEFKTVAKYSILSITCLVTILTAILIAISPLIARVYQSDWQTNTELYNLTKMALRYYLLSLPFVAFNVSFASFVQSVCRNNFANIVNAFTECIVLVAACYLLSGSYQYAGFFGGFFFGELALTVALILIVIVHRLLTRNNKYSLYFIKDGYINQNDKILHAVLKGYDDIEHLSVQAQALCNDTHLTKSQSYKVGLCVEEMATNVFEHGFVGDSNKHIMEMRIVVSESNAVITLVDDCNKFDISKKLKTWSIDKEHPEKNIGIRTIMLIAKNVTYSNTMNMNNLQITI